MRTSVKALGALVAATLMLAGCAGSPAAAPAATRISATPSPTLHGTLTVFAAASLKKGFDAIAKDFVRAHSGVDILPIVYDGSSTLATQITQGASVDVFASADQKNMTKVTAAGLAADPRPFATNTLVIATPKANPAHVTSLADLGRSGVTVVLCAPEVPCGAAAQTLLRNEGVQVTPASQEQNVTAVLTKVAAGEADAGLVYATDVKGVSAVSSIVPAGADKVVNTYPVVALSGSRNAAAASAFVAYVLSPAGQKVLQSLGFGAP